MTSRGSCIVLAAAFVFVTPARSGHESPVYPSFYPQEIALMAVAPDRAADLLLAGRIQAYIGDLPRFAAAPPSSIDSIESLGSFVIVRINPVRNGQTACAIADTMIREIAGKSGEMVVHPYPVTPFNGDYLHYADLVETARARGLGSGAGPLADARLKVRADGNLARSMVRDAWRTQESDWDAEIIEIDAAKLIAGASVMINGWSGPPWLRAGWFQAYLLLGEPADVDDAQMKPIVERLKNAAHSSAVERINLERTLVSTLAGSCRARVAGYTVKREYFNTAFTAGIENVSYDSVTGLNAPMFIRTVKLKDFPWNGWLTLGTDTAPEAAWNPIAGFTDNFGRLMWSAVGDPASIPSPNEAAWMLNRVSDVQASGKQ